MTNKGKIFEQDFQKSAEKTMMTIRLNDPGGSFNIKCQNCPKKKTRFSPRHPCDFICAKDGITYLFELKSIGGTSIPFKSIVKNERDKRLEKMVRCAWYHGVESYVVFNWRKFENKTMAVMAEDVYDYMRFSGRKSIPYIWTIDENIEIKSRLKKVRYEYFFDELIRSLNGK